MHRVGIAVRRAQRDTDEVEVAGCDRADRGAVVLVVAGREHLVRVDRERDAAALGALAHGLELRGAGLEHEHRLHEQRQVALVVGVEVVLADRGGAGVRGHAADQERGDVQPLPGGEVVANHDRDLRFELADAHRVDMVAAGGRHVLNDVAVGHLQRRRGQDATARA